MFIFAGLFVVSFAISVADAVPVFDLKKTCQGTAIEAVFVGRNAETCVKSEEVTRDQLKKSWGEFPPADKTDCVNTAKIGGRPSYTELITCLEMKRDVKKLRGKSS